MNKNYLNEEDQMHNNLKSVVEFPNLKNRPKFLCIKKKKKIERLLQSQSGEHV